MTQKNTHTGTVIKSTGSWYKVKTASGEVYDCRLRGKFRIKGIQTTNPVTVGDEVEISRDKKESAVITQILPRQNYLIRKSSKLSKKYHLVAANVDQILLISTIVKPKIVFGFIDRILASAEAYDIPVILAFNKTDLNRDKDYSKLAEALTTYEEIGYKCLLTSAVSGDGLDDLRLVLTGKRTVLTGQSGVGKSSLINKIQPGLNLKTEEISDSNEKGKHTTTFAQLHELSFGGEVIDTPGVRSFGIADFDRQHLAHYFREIQDVSGDCKFHNCVHVNEPGCAVKKAVEDEEISPRRYFNYLEIYENENLEKDYS